MDSTACDSILVELHKPYSPFELVVAEKGLLYTNGNIVVIFPSLVKLGSHFLTIKHRNSVETWSIIPVALQQNTIYDLRY